MLLRQPPHLVLLPRLSLLISFPLEVLAVCSIMLTNLPSGADDLVLPLVCGCITVSLWVYYH